MPSGPTVTASGRQVRSRATGLYGETLHSGQVTDHGSPATGDYVRSDASEEPAQPAQPAHGRSTRAATNGRPLNRVMDSDEDDATSWDGGDEDDEPEQMDVDDLSEEDGDDDDQDAQTLVVTLRYGKGKQDEDGVKKEKGPPIDTTNPASNQPLQDQQHHQQQQQQKQQQQQPQPLHSEPLPTLETLYPASSAPSNSGSADDTRTNPPQGFQPSVSVTADAGRL